MPVADTSVSCVASVVRSVVAGSTGRRVTVAPWAVRASAIWPARSDACSGSMRSQWAPCRDGVRSGTVRAFHVTW